MQKINLTSDQKHELMQLHHKTRYKRVCDRINKAIIRLSNACSTSQIAEALLIYETSVNRYINKYLATGKLKPENGDSNDYLSIAQTEYSILHYI